MGDNSAIEWTDATWNPVTGCTKVSAGCKNCYAERWAGRHLGEFAKDRTRKFTDVQCHEDKLQIPLKWKKPRRIFVNSMSDLFHDDIPFEFFMKVMGVMLECSPVSKDTPNHTFQILTKRAEDLLWFTERFYGDLVNHLFEKFVETDPEGQMIIRAVGTDPGEDVIRRSISHIWFGVSVEDRKALHRIECLRQSPWPTKFLSIEPLLEDLGTIDFTGVGWVIVGGESGPNARPMHPNWVRSIRDQCQAANVPFHFKQWGEWSPSTANHRQTRNAMYSWGDVKVERFGKKAAGRILDGHTWDEFPR